MSGSIYKDKEEQQNKGPVFEVSSSRNADVEEELERRKRKKEEQEKWMLNAPDKTAQKVRKMQEANKKKKVYASEEEAQKELLKDYFKVSEPVLPWEADKFPEFSKELNDILKATLSDNSSMTKSHFGVLKSAVQSLANARNDELRQYYLDLVYAAARDYIKRSTKKTNKRRLERAEKLRVQIIDHKRKLLSRQERIEKKMAANDKDVQPILRYMQAIESLKSDTIRPYPVDGDEKAKDEYRKEISGMGMMFAMQYNKLISACELFLSKDGKPAVVLEHYEKIRNKAEEELKIFNNALTDFLCTSGTDKDITWGDALASRTNNYARIDTKKQKNMGAGTSNVFKIERGTSEFDYFKEEENIGKNIEDCWDIVYNDFKNQGLSNIALKILKDVDEALRKDIRKVENEKDPQKKADMKSKFYDLMVKKPHRYKNYFVHIGLDQNETIKQATEDADYAAFDLLKTYGEVTPELLRHTTRILEAFMKNYNCYVMATKVAGIKEGSNLSARNVATYRMAVALGIEESVARSETAKIQKNKKLVFGNLMEEAKGVEASKAGRNKEKKYTSKCVCDMAMMQIFDLICGQIDRNGRNYYVNETTEGIDSIKMIDNDLAFGNLSADDLMKGKQSMPMFIDALILTMPDRFKRRILELDKKTMGFMLEDILSAEEIDAANKRLEVVKKKIRLIDSMADERKKSDKRSERFEAYLMQFDEYRALNYQLELYKTINKENERFANNERRSQLKMGDISYLHENNMISEEEIKKRIKEFQDKHKKDKWDGR